MPDAPGPSVTQGEVWTVQQWNAFFASLAGKVDVAGGDASACTALAAGASVARTLAARAADVVNILDFSALEDNLTDDAPAFSRAIAHLNSVGGGRLDLNAKTYLIGSAVATPVTPITIAGKGAADQGPTGGGTWLHINGAGYQPFNFNAVGARGSIIQDLGVYQDHPAPVVGWAPTVYPPVFQVGSSVSPYTAPNGTITLRRILACPVYALVNGYLCGRLTLDDIRGQAFSYMVSLDKCYDVVRSSSIHSWPYWSSEANVMLWQTANSNAVILKRVDGFEANDIFAIGVKSALQLSNSVADSGGNGGGICRNFSVKSLYADFSTYGVWVTGGATYATANNYLPIGWIGNLFTNGSAWGTSTSMAGATSIQVDGILDITVGRHYAANHAAGSVIVSNTSGSPAGSRLTFHDFSADGWDQLSSGAPVVSLATVTAGSPHACEVASYPLMMNSLGSGPFSVGTQTGVDAPVIRSPGNDLMSVSSTTLSGGTTTMPNDRTALILEQISGGTVTSYTVALPASPRHGDEASITCTQPVTTLSLSAGVPIVAPATSLVAGIGTKLRYIGMGSGSPSWVRVG